MPLNEQPMFQARGEPPRTKVTLEQLHSRVDPHVLLQVAVLVARFPTVVTLPTVITFANIISVGFHMVQRHETSLELFVALEALECFLTSVVSHMVVHDVSPVGCLGAMRALELTFLYVCLDVSLQGPHLREPFLTKFTVKGLEETLFFLVHFLSV